MAPARRPVLGWREWVALPGLRIKRIKAKLDTGARTSALHAEDVRTYVRGGRERVSFMVHPTQRTRRGAVRCRADLVAIRRVKTSGGHVTERPMIRTPLQVGDDVHEIELTLIDRDEMGFRMLLGRQALSHRFLVDPGRSFVMGVNGRRGRR